MAAALTLMCGIFGSVGDASAFSKSKYNMTLSGGNSISKKTGSAWANLSPQSYVSVASKYKYKDASGNAKTVPTSITGNGGSSAAGWSYTLAAGCKSVSIRSDFTGIYKGKTLTESESTTY